MSMATFARYRSLLASHGKSLVGDPRMILGREGRYSLQYMPFEPSSSSARLVIVGITPGTTQLSIAYDAVQTLLRSPPVGRSLTDAEILSEVKRRAGFGGRMRENLLRMLRRFQIGRLIGVPNEEDLWNVRSDALHSTSIIPNAAFIHEEMYSNSFDDILNSNLLRGCFERDFLTSLTTLPRNAVFIALGPTPLAALEWCVGSGYLSASRVLGAFAHPSGQGGSRVNVYLGLTDPATLHPNDPVRYQVPWLLQNAARMDTATSGGSKQLAVVPLAKSGGLFLPAVWSFAISASAPIPPSRETHTPQRRTKGVGAQPLSPLGIEIEKAVVASRRFIRHDEHARMCTFRTYKGTVFAFERVTKKAINLRNYIPNKGRTHRYAHAYVVRKLYLTKPRTVAFCAQKSGS
jgi:hypothetical protein